MTLVLLYVTAVAIPCHAEDNVRDDGNTLLRICSIALNIFDETGKDFDVGDAVSGGICMGFMQGITNLNLIYQSMVDHDPLFCIPEGGITNGQAARVVVKYLKNHPEQLHKDMITLTVLAFKKVFPCKK